MDIRHLELLRDLRERFARLQLLLVEEKSDEIIARLRDGRLDAGLFFIVFARDPRAGFFPILRKMTEKDALTEYLQHVGSALFAVPPGVAEGDTMVGQRLFE